MAPFWPLFTHRSCLERSTTSHVWVTARCQLEAGAHAARHLTSGCACDCAQLALVPVSPAESASPGSSGPVVRVPDTSPSPSHALAPGAASLARLLGGAHIGMHPGMSPSVSSATPGGAGGWAARAGVLPAWGMRGVAWALLSDAPGALLDACLPQARTAYIHSSATARLERGRFHVVRAECWAKLPIPRECHRRSVTHALECDRPNAQLKPWQKRAGTPLLQLCHV